MADHRTLGGRRLPVPKGIIAVLTAALLLLLGAIASGLLEVRSEVLWVLVAIATGLVAATVAWLVSRSGPGQAAPVFTRLKLINPTKVPFKAKTEQELPPPGPPPPPPPGPPEVVAPPQTSAVAAAPEGSYFFDSVQGLRTTITRGDPFDPNSPQTTFAHAVPPGSGGAILEQDLCVVCLDETVPPPARHYMVVSQIYVLEIGPMGEDIYSSPPPMALPLN